MILQANKKFIDTSHVAHLLTAGEKYADKLVFSVERFYQETDLSGCLFVMRGVNSAGNLALEALGLRAYLDCDMCLGEGTGGVIGAKLFDFALAAYGEIAGFDAVGIAPYEKLQ